MARLEGNQTVELTVVRPSGDTYLTIWQVDDNDDGTTTSRCIWALGPTYHGDRDSMRANPGEWIDNQSTGEPEERAEGIPAGDVHSSEVLRTGPTLL